MFWVNYNKQLAEKVWKIDTSKRNFFNGTGSCDLDLENHLSIFARPKDVYGNLRNYIIYMQIHK